MNGESLFFLSDLSCKCEASLIQFHCSHSDAKKQDLEVFIARSKEKVDELKTRLEEEAEKKARKQHGPAVGITVQPEPIKLDYNTEWRKECREMLIEQCVDLNLPFDLLVSVSEGS